jgi:hypothetical protein
MSIKKIEAFEVNGIVFTSEKEAMIYDTKNEIVNTLKKIEEIDFITISTLNTFALEELRRIGRMADKILTA